MSTIFETIVRSYGDRPVGSPANEALLLHIEEAFRRSGLAVEALPFTAHYWRGGSATLRAGGREFALHTGPFSPPFAGEAPLVCADTPEALLAAGLEGQIVVLHGPLAADGYMPKDFPFYYPDEHKAVIEALEGGGAAAVVGVTGKHPMSGQDPYPLFEDGNFAVPNAYTGEAGLLEACRSEARARLDIVSSVEPRPSRQLIGRRLGLGAEPARIVVCAHMDTKYGTPGAIDNATGVAVLLELAERSGEWRTPFTVDFAPFNGEEYYAVAGQLRYAETLQAGGAPVRLAINLDGLGLAGSRNAFSLYNFGDADRALVADAAGSGGAVPGPEWYAGDHAMFVFAGTPAIAFTSSDLDAALQVTHTERDAPGIADPALVSAACDAVIAILNAVR